MDIYEPYVKCIDNERIIEYLYDLKFEGKYLDGDFHSTIFLLIKSLYPKKLLDIALNNVKNLSTRYDYRGYMKNSKLNNGMFVVRNYGSCKCNKCKTNFGINNKLTYEFYLPNGCRSLYGCETYINKTIDFANSTIKYIGEKKMSYLLFLLKQTPLYFHVDIDVFFTICRLLIINFEWNKGIIIKKMTF